MNLKNTGVSEGIVGEIERTIHLSAEKQKTVIGSIKDVLLDRSDLPGKEGDNAMFDRIDVISQIDR